METRSGNYAAPPTGRRLRRLRLGQFDRQICQCRLLRHRILALADRRPYIFLLGRFFRQKMPTKKKTVGYAILSGVFLAFDLALWHEHSRRRPRHFHLAQQPADFLF